VFTLAHGMAKNKQDKNQLALKFGLNDERIPKLLGIICWFFGLYLFIAFFSYLFTWQKDQSEVLRFSWGLLLYSEIEMANWLGRLGAIISNLFFYWGIGLPSFGFVYLLLLSGKTLIRRSSEGILAQKIRVTVALMAFFAVFLEFVFGKADFPWGGALGQYAADWLQSFLGLVGLAVLFLLLIVGVITWVFNPNYHEMTPGSAAEDIRQFFADLLAGRRSQRSRAIASSSAKVKDTPESTAKGTQVPALPKTENAFEEVPQLSLDFDQPSATPPVQRTDETRLEIHTPPPPMEAPPASDVAIGQAGHISEENVDHSEPYDPTLELSAFENPVLSLLEDYPDQKVEVDRAELEANKDQIIETLLNYKIEITKIRATIGPTVTLYEIVPAPGVRISRIKNLEDDIALSLAALGIRIIAPIPGKGTIGIEVPNKNKQIVSMKEVLQSDKFRRAKMDLPIALGKTISNEIFVADLAKMPHLLMAGATGQGKSVGINTVIMSLLYKKHPSQVKLVLIDPKKVELSPYSKLESHYLAFLPGQEEPIVTETNKVIHTLNSLTIEMDTRYNLLKKAGARNIREYNEKFVQRQLNPLKGHRFLPFIVLVIDEFADLIMTAGKEVELPIGRLAQLARAVGIHLIIATQRPSVNIITGVIKANFPARIAFKVSAKVDSRTIMDAGGADQLIGRGDMLLSVGGDMVRIQCAFVDTPEVERVVDFIHKQQGYTEPYYLPEYEGEEGGGLPGSSGTIRYADLDEMYEDAARLIVQTQHGSTSMIQRRLKLGYNRAGRLMDQLESTGIVGPADGSKAREVLVYDEMELNRFLEDLKKR
jgi:S-DNA-T family DNA segregation ATPase FtsK/SpoIIIE